jgi:hypothetical protein
MTESDWRSVIDQASALDVSMVQFIGGEPTAHPQFASLLRYAIGSGLAVEVYTNLLHVKDTWWELFACPNVSLATSWYSDSPGQHDAITQRRGSHAKTRANITEAIRRVSPCGRASSAWMTASAQARHGQSLKPSGSAISAWITCGKSGAASGHRSLPSPSSAATAVAVSPPSPRQEMCGHASSRAG